MPENLYKTDKSFDGMTEETRHILTHVMFNNDIEWPVCRRHLKRVMVDDEHYAGDDKHVFLREYLMKGLSPISEIPETVLNEIWKTYMYRALQRNQMKKLETEIELSDEELITMDEARQLFKPFGHAVLKWKSKMIRVQPFCFMDPSRYYMRASRAKAIIYPRMVDQFHICKSDILKAVQIMEETKVEDSSKLKIKLTDC